MLIEPTESRWLGLALRSESDQPHEWLPIAWVIRNRVESRIYPDTYAGVVTQRQQFSYFNHFQRVDGPEEIFAAALEGYAGENAGWHDNDYLHACECASAVRRMPRWMAPFSPRVFHFWSPVSMVPKGSDPAWAEDLRVFALPGIHAQRFKFGES
jgi:hypothetical protein